VVMYACKWVLCGSHALIYAYKWVLKNDDFSHDSVAWWC